MQKSKRILTLSLAMVMLAFSSGFAMHSVRCLMTGETHHSLVSEKCCCSNTAPQAVSSNCCDELTTLLKQDIEAVQPAPGIQVSPVFFTVFITQFMAINRPDGLMTNNFNFLKESPPLSDRQIILLVQSFLL